MGYRLYPNPNDVHHQKYQGIWKEKKNNADASRVKREMKLHSTCSPLYYIKHYQFESNIELEMKIKELTID